MLRDTTYNSPLITIGVICYNTGQFVTEALNSVLAQTYKNYEIIILDDKSPDQNSVQIIENYLKERNLDIRFIKRESNQGLAKNFQQIAALANPKSVFFSCIGDDLWHPTFLEENIKALMHTKESVIACFSDSVIVKYSTKEIIKHSIFKIESSTNPVYSQLLTNKTENYYLLQHKPLLEALIVGNFINAISVVYKLKQYQKAGGHNINYDIEDYPTWVDWAKKGYDFIYINKVLSTYNIHGENYSVKYSSKVHNVAKQIQLKNLKYTNSSEAIISTYFRLLNDEKSYAGKIRIWLKIIKEKPSSVIRLPYLLLSLKRKSNSTN